jgi:signal peptidase I
MVKTRSPRPVTFLRELLNWLLTLALACALAFIVNTFLLGSNEVLSYSMQPTLAEQNRILISKLAYSLGSPQRDEILIFDPPVTPKSPSPYIKRVIGLPGEVVDISGGAVWINGQKLAEPYACGQTLPGKWSHIVVPQDSLIVMGDNRENSLDSRSFGPVPLSSLEGRVILRYWPIGLLQTF